MPFTAGRWARFVRFIERLAVGLKGRANGIDVRQSDIEARLAVVEARVAYYDDLLARLEHWIQFLERRFPHVD